MISKIPQIKVHPGALCVSPVVCSYAGMSWFRRILTFFFKPQLYRLERGFFLDIPNIGRVVIPAKFITDGASVPRWLWWLIHPFHPTIIHAAVIHDFAYKHNFLSVITGDRTNTRIKRVVGNRGRHYFDKLFFYLIVAISRAEVTALVAWAALYLFGWVAWNKHRRAESKLSAKTDCSV